MTRRNIPGYEVTWLDLSSAGAMVSGSIWSEAPADIGSHMAEPHWAVSDGIYWVIGKRPKNHKSWWGAGTAGALVGFRCAPNGRSISSDKNARWGQYASVTCERDLIDIARRGERVLADWGRNSAPSTVEYSPEYEGDPRPWRVFSSRDPRSSLGWRSWKECYVLA